MALYVRINDQGEIIGFAATKSRDDPPPGGETAYRIYSGAATAIFPIASLLKAAPELVKIQRESKTEPPEVTLRKLSKLSQDFGVDVRVVKVSGSLNPVIVGVFDAAITPPPIIIRFVDP